MARRRRRPTRHNETLLAEYHAERDRVAEERDQIAAERDDAPPAYPGRTAGPTLDVARPAYFVLPHRDPAWKIINERLDVLTGTCAALAQEPTPTPRRAWSMRLAIGRTPTT